MGDKGRIKNKGIYKENFEYKVIGLLACENRSFCRSKRRVFSNFDLYPARKMTAFYKNGFDELEINLQSSKILGLQDGGYVEDYYGNGDAITLRRVGTSTRRQLLLAELDNVEHDLYRALVDLANFEEGVYELEGLVRDRAGNYTLVGRVLNPPEEYVQTEFKFQYVEGSFPIMMVEVYTGIELVEDTKRSIVLMTETSLSVVVEARCSRSMTLDLKSEPKREVLS